MGQHSHLTSVESGIAERVVRSVMIRIFDASSRQYRQTPVMRFEEVRKLLRFLTFSQVGQTFRLPVGFGTIVFPKLIFEPT